MTGTLRREIGAPGAVLLGLGSILGTGVFVSLALATDLAGTGVVWAVAIAAVVALCNGLSSAQLAAAHPVAGGTYEYGYRVLHPVAGLTAGWLFLVAKSASAATAALGVGDYLGLDWWTAPVIVGLVTGVVVGGLRRSNRVNALLVALTVGALATLVVVDGVAPPEATAATATGSIRDLLEAAALVFVAFTGYGRVATLGEEVHDPRSTVPRAVIATLAVAAVLYLVVAWTLTRHPGIEAGNAPLVLVASRHGIGLATIIRIAALAAMVGVLLNLVLGLSRVVLAMGRRSDLPAVFARIDADGTSPVPAVVGVAVVVAGLSLIGDVGLTWSLSAATVLLYYAITNVAALSLPERERRFSRVYPVVGLVGCVGLAVFVDPWVWIPAAAVIGFMVAIHLARRTKSDHNRRSSDERDTC